MFRNLSIKFKLFLTYAAVSLLVLSISFTLFYFEVQKELKQRIKEELTQSNHIITDMVETSARVSIKNHLRAIAEKNREIVAHIYETFQKGLLTESQAVDQAANVLFSQTVGETGYIYCIDSSGTAVVHHEKGVEGQNYAYRDFIQKQIKYKKGYLEYNWKNPDEPKARPKALYMAYFEPWDWIITASSYKSEFSSLISIVDFKDQIRRLNFGDSGYSFICDTQGNVLIHPELTRLVFDENTRAGEVIQKIIQQEKGFLSYMWKNPSEKHAREKFVAFEPILNFNWIVASSSYKEEIFSTLDKIKNFFWIVLLMAFIIIAGVTLTVSATITEPLIRFIQFLEKAAKQSQDNHKSLDSRIDEVRSDEIGKMYKSFNLFMEKLDSYSKELISEIKMRKKTENELYHLQSYLGNIINSMPSVLIGIDMEKSITQWNKKAEELTRTARSDALGNPLPDIFPWIQTHMQLVEKSFDTKTIQQISRLPMEMEHTDSTYHDITIYPLFDQGLQGAVILIDDVTEKVKIQEVLIQNEKMISVGGLAAGMAHEINNPLAALIQNAAVLENRLTNTAMPPNVKAAENADTTMESILSFMQARKVPAIISSIKDSGLRMAAIVENMLNFARKSDDSFSSRDPVQLMEKTLEIAAADYNLKKHYDFKSIVIDKKFEQNLPLLVCEGNKIQQVLLNILNNGAQAMFENPQAEKNRFILRISREEESDMLRMEIQDNGPGMTEAVKKKIFEPFFTTKPIGVGTGLGLSISYFIITENHGGTLDVLSKPGKGARFIIRLPFKSVPGKNSKRQ